MGAELVPQCMHEDYYDDMYPEFAPDPIVDRCELPGTWQVTFMNAWNPEPPHSPTEEVLWLCNDHASLLREQGDHEYCYDRKWVNHAE